MTSCAPTFPLGRAEQWVRVIPGPASTASPGGRPSFSAHAQADRFPPLPEVAIKSDEMKTNKAPGLRLPASRAIPAVRFRAPGRPEQAARASPDPGDRRRRGRPRTRMIAGGDAHVAAV